MRKSFVLMITLVILLLTCVAVFAANAAPGSEEDPVVSKSYVDARTDFATVQLEEGQKLIGAGGTEIILRSGEATAIDNGENGVSDLTSGADIMTDGQVGLNHLLLVPRDDGRGITAMTESWVLVRGGYTVQ